MAQELSEAEKQALAKFRENIWDLLGSLDEYEALDVDLVRWLRARDLDVQKAEEMFRKSMKWRVDYKVDEKRDGPISDYYLEKLPFGSSGHDKQGAYICVIPYGLWETKMLAESGHAEALVGHIVLLLEKAVNYLKLQSSQKEGNVQTQFVLIVDLDQFSLTQVLSKQVITVTTRVLATFEANYPERLKAGFIINAPKVFEVFFALIKPFVARHTLSKVQIFASNPEKWKRALLENADHWELPSRYGGTNSGHEMYKNAFNYLWPPRADPFPEEQLTSVVVPAGTSFTVRVDVEANSRISWNFKTEAYDIGFKFLNEDGTEILRLALADAHLNLQDGLLRFLEKGSYSLVFDNTHSKLRSKKLFYAVRVEPDVAQAT